MNKITVITGLIIVVSVPSTYAAEWTADIQANPTFGYDDNILLEEDEQGSLEYSIAPTLVLGRAVENLSSFLSLGYSIERFSSVSGLDSENPFARFNGNYSTERTQFGLSASYAEDNTRNEAFEDNGDFSTGATSRTRSISPSISYELTERDTLTSNFNYSERQYSSEDFSDNETKSLSVGWSRRFTERFSGGLNSSVTNFQNDSMTFSTDDDSYNVSTYLSYQLSEVWGIEGNIGVRRLKNERTSTNGMIVRGTSTGSTFDITSNYSRELDDISLNYSKQLSPSSSGEVNEQERISATWSHKLSEALSANIVASYQESTSASDEFDDEKRENINFSPSLRWQVDAKLGLNFGYAYRQQKRTNASDVDSNAVTVALTYDWDGYRVSR
jgi:hypothetical protein